MSGGVGFENKRFLFPELVGRVVLRSGRQAKCRSGMVCLVGLGGGGEEQEEEEGEEEKKQVEKQERREKEEQDEEEEQKE